MPTLRFGKVWQVIRHFGILFFCNLGTPKTVILNFVTTWQIETPYSSPCKYVYWTKNGGADKMVEQTNVLIPWYPISYLTIASSVFFWGAYGSLPDAAIWWCLRTGGGGILTSVCPPL